MSTKLYKDGKIARKPLKSRKKISEKNSRVVAITDKKLWTELVNLYNIQVESLENNQWGTNPLDYALFESFDRTTASTRLKNAYKKCEIRYKSWHFTTPWLRHFQESLDSRLRGNDKKP